ncbi:DUF4337 domain-containing protein [Boseaceae bacterium BT-24-1]|nr:DUF4337 domain-containing protein [Boseaceae bacterium BT-24-1]
MGAHESMEQSEHAQHASSSSKRIALLIAIIALCLALSETLGKSAQTEALNRNIEASNLWAFFQAKTVRMTAVRTAAEGLQTQLEKETDAAFRAAAGKRVDFWQKTAQRYDDEPETNEGRRQLVTRAKTAEEKRDLAFARYHHFEVASATFQIGIVLASATIITGIALLSWGAAMLAAIGLSFTAIGLFAPHAVHLF